MTQTESKKLKSIFLRIGTETYVQLFERFKKVCENNIKLELQQSKDLCIEERIKKHNINNINDQQKQDLLSVINLLKDEQYRFTKNDIPLLDNFTARIDYLLKGTSPRGKGMADQINNVKDGAIFNNDVLHIDTLFNEFKIAENWTEFEKNTTIPSSFFDRNFKWKLVYVFSNCKNCQQKDKYPLYYAAWQVIADWCFDIPYGDYDSFCKHYNDISFLPEPKLLYFNIYYDCIRLSLRTDNEYIEFLSSFDQNKKMKIMREIRENEERNPDENYFLEQESNHNGINTIHYNYSHFIIEINSLSNVFSIVESGSEIRYKIIIPGNPLSIPEMKSGDKILVVVKDKITYNLIVENTDSEGSLVLRKVFEIDRSAHYSFAEQAKIYKIGKEEYDNICSLLFFDFFNKQNSKESSKNIDLGNLKEKFANWLFDKRRYTRVYKNNIEILKEKLNEYEIAYNNDFGILIFDYPNTSIESIINALEANKIDDTGEIGDLNKRTVGNGSVKAILGSKNYIEFLKDLLLKSKISISKSPKTTPVNKIYFGAPGTGKSYQITQDLKDIDLIFQKRVTFHPEYDYASFVGGYKPITDNDGNIKYEFVPQIFTNIYVEACNDPDHQYYLIIEEINRGNCAEIFGELFQLLDRDKNYKITPSNEVINYLSNNISNSEYFKDNKMLLPDNLSILSTMNTSDQSLFPMDSAFKRRWEWEYIPINYSKDESINKSANYTIIVDSTIRVNWIDFIKKINFKIQENQNLGMDKCIGNYFIKPSESGEIGLGNFIHKVIFYLWNDVFKDETKDSIFKDKISYQSFFPIPTEGLKLVTSIFKDLNLLEPNKTEEE